MRKPNYPPLLEIDNPTPESESIDSSLVYTYVEQMPLLNGQPAFAAITHALVAPADAPDGRVFVQFIVNKEGKVSQPQVVKGLRADVDSAVVVATRLLPRFSPGKHADQAVAVSIVVAVTFPVKQPEWLR